MKKTISYLFAIGAIMVLSRCQDEPSLAPQSPEQVAQREVNGTLLAEIPVSEGYTVSFWDFGQGVFAFKESLSADAKASPEITLDDFATDGASLSSIYEGLAGADLDPGVLKVFNKADLQMKVMEQQRTAVKELIADNASASGAALDEGNKSASACSGDYYNDQWGARWFLDRYCTEGGFRWCPTNRTWAYSGTQKTKWFKTCGMAADFDIGARLKGQHWHNGAWRTDWDYTIPARRVECWTYTGTGYRQAWVWGLSPCQRIHASVMDRR